MKIFENEILYEITLRKLIREMLSFANRNSTRLIVDLSKDEMLNLWEKSLKGDDALSDADMRFRDMQLSSAEHEEAMKALQDAMSRTAEETVVIADKIDDMLQLKRKNHLTLYQDDWAESKIAEWHVQYSDTLKWHKKAGQPATGPGEAGLVIAFKTREYKRGDADFMPLSGGQYGVKFFQQGLSRSAVRSTKCARQVLALEVAVNNLVSQVQSRLLMQDRISPAQRLNLRMSSKDKSKNSTNHKKSLAKGVNLQWFNEVRSAIIQQTDETHVPDVIKRQFDSTNSVANFLQIGDQTLVEAYNTALKDLKSSIVTEGLYDEGALICITPQSAEVVRDPDRVCVKSIREERPDFTISDAYPVKWEFPMLKTHSCPVVKHMQPCDTI